MFMSIDYQVEVRENYVYLNCHGEFKQGAAEELFEKAFLITEQSDRYAVLVDVRNVTGNPPSSMERFHIGVFVAKLRFLNVCMALVGNSPLIDIQRFGETVALNRGAWVGAFNDYDAAVVWLEREMGKTRRTRKD